MAIEASRGCGYRKVGGLYICSSGPSLPCDRLPYPLELCPVCGAGIKFSRAWTWLDWHKYAGYHYVNDLECHCKPGVGQLCPICFPREQDMPYGLLWVGEASYTPESFAHETAVMGVSRRIPAIPRGLKLGRTVVLLAHKDAVSYRVLADVDKAWGDIREGTKPEELTPLKRPGVFEAFIPQTLELLIWKSEATEEKLAELGKRSITSIIIPDGDKDHDPDVKRSTSENSAVRELSELRNTLLGR